MITYYIKRDVQGYYIDFPDEIDAEYWDGMIGTTLEDFYNNKWVKLSDEQVAFHEEHPNASLHEVFNMEMTPEPERTLDDAKMEKLDLIDQYDRGDHVNTFYVQIGLDTISTWFTPTERSNYRSSIDAAELVNVENLSLYVGDNLISLPTATAKLMLAQIQLYADQCYIVTRQHKSAVEALDSIEAVDNYDYTVGYPEKLTFTL